MEPRDDESGKAEKRSLSLYPTQVADAKLIAQHYRLKGLSAAVQRAIEDTAEFIRRKETAERQERAA